MRSDLRVTPEPRSVSSWIGASLMREIQGARPPAPVQLELTGEGIVHRYEWGVRVEGPRRGAGVRRGFGSPTWAESHLWIPLPPACVVDAHSLLPEVDVGKILSAGIGGGEVDGLAEDVLFGDGVDDDNVAEGVDKGAALDAPRERWASGYKAL